MKKSILGLIVGILLFSSACKKSYTCSCKMEDKDSTGYVYNTGVYVVSEKSRSKGDVESSCESDAKASLGTQPAGNPSGDSRTFNCTVTKD